jgi:hypothetical protein
MTGTCCHGDLSHCIFLTKQLREAKYSEATCCGEATMTSRIAGSQGTEAGVMRLGIKRETTLTAQ